MLEWAVSPDCGNPYCEQWANESDSPHYFQHTVFATDNSDYYTITVFPNTDCNEPQPNEHDWVVNVHFEIGTSDSHEPVDVVVSTYEQALAVGEAIHQSMQAATLIGVYESRSTE